MKHKYIYDRHLNYVLKV